MRDPLCRSQSLAYLQGLTAAGYSFALITFENSSLAMSASESEIERQSLAETGIHWYPVRWESGTSIAGKLKSISAAVMTGARVVRRHKVRLVHSRSSLPVAVALVLTQLFGLKFLYDADSVLSEEYADTGHLSRTSRGFKLMANSEAKARRRADRMIVLTEVLKERFAPEVRGPIDVIPCCVDTRLFVRTKSERLARRTALGLSRADKLLIYVGKPGSWYLIDETFEFFREFRKVSSTAKLLIVSQSDHEAYEEFASRAGLTAQDYFIRSASPVEVPHWLSAADAGLSLIRQVDSKKGSSPVKFGEYLACGLPVVVTDGIGDCSSVIRKYDAGVILDRADTASIQQGARSLEKMLAIENAPVLQERCRRAAIEEFDLIRVGHERYREVYKSLIPSNFE